MRKVKVILLSTILVLALLVTLIACTGVEANAKNGALNEDEVVVNYVIKFVTNTDEVMEEKETRTLEVEPIPNASYKSGYDFAGWYLTSDFSGSPITFPYTFTHNTTLYAKWISKAVTKIATAEQLQEINNNLAGDYVLVANIDLSHFDHFKYADPITLSEDDYDDVEAETARLTNIYKNSWIPIAGKVGDDFTGTFDGNGYIISGMQIIITDYDVDPEFNYLPVGLFGKVSGRVSNVTLVNHKIQMDGDCSRFYVGGVVGWAYQGEVNNCTAIGDVINLKIEYEGNLWDSLFGSYAEPTENTYFGGVVGLIEESTATGLSSEGRVTSESNADAVYVGGAVGYILSGSLTRSNSIAFVKGKYPGGLVGYNNGAISKSFAMGDVEGSLAYPAVAGGLVSYNFNAGTISACYATGNVKARTAGGLVGVNIFDFKLATGGTIVNAYAAGDVYASEYAGGLVGRAVSDLPIFGREEFSPLIYNNKDDYGTSNTRFSIIRSCFAYGKVEANAVKTLYEDYKGESKEPDVYYAVFAGSLIGQAYELLIKGCIGFGDVSGVSNRPIGDGEGDDADYMYNAAYVDNFVGHSTNVVFGADYRTVYAVEGMEVKSNGMIYEGGYNSVEYQNYSNLNNATFYIQSLGFNAVEGDDDVWSFNNLNIEAGQYPTLNLN
ncbi:MAG: InlB B-repeat-containing protein [Clostridia bacterium]|nr:InlB B-repeat-containing protein [Clostridia bacterium]